MKQSFKTTALFLALVATTSLSSFALDKESKRSSRLESGIYTTLDGKVKIMVEKQLTEAPTHLLLKNDEGAILYRETIKKSYDRFGKTLNLSELEMGSYQIEISSKGITKNHTFEIKSSSKHPVISLIN
ncbi:hypothetical protein [Dyadobacter jejuensis]|nr:hypothetical protein [Dyadobacter jejuensis]